MPKLKINQQVRKRQVSVYRKTMSSIKVKSAPINMQQNETLLNATLLDLLKILKDYQAPAPPFLYDIIMLNIEKMKTG